MPPNKWFHQPPFKQEEGEMKYILIGITKQGNKKTIKVCDSIELAEQKRDECLSGLKAFKKKLADMDEEIRQGLEKSLFIEFEITGG